MREIFGHERSRDLWIAGLQCLLKLVDYIELRGHGL